MNRQYGFPDRSLTQVMVSLMSIMVLAMGSMAEALDDATSDAASKVAEDANKRSDEPLQLRDLINPKAHASEQDSIKSHDSESKPAENDVMDIESLLDELESEKDSDSEERDDDQSADDESTRRDASQPRLLNDAMARLRPPMTTLRVSHATNDPTSETKRPTNRAAKMTSLQALRPVSLAMEGVIGNLDCTPCFTTEPAFCHRPLLFEQPNLERCGNGWGWVQNPVSFARFFSDTLTLPIRTQYEPASCTRPSGPDCRCGQCLSRR